jgi:tRNA threonylcarbamoyladenosine biosynthesis protein TsaB
MILLLDTSTPICRLTLVEGDNTHVYEWQADRQLAKGLLEWIQQQLAAHQKTWRDITGIGAYRGPGSFTGLRIGLTVANTLADSISAPIVGVMGESWQAEALDRLKKAENDRIVMPYYDRDANITMPRK